MAIRKFEDDTKRAHAQVSAIMAEMKMTHPQQQDYQGLCPDCALRVLASWPELLPDTSRVFAQHFGGELVQTLDPN